MALNAMEMAAVAAVDVYAITDFLENSVNLE